MTGRGLLQIDGASAPIRNNHRSACRSEGDQMRGGLLWLLGVPIPVIILLYVFHVI
jgi:hypothetical protein